MEQLPIGQIIAKLQHEIDLLKQRVLKLEEVPGPLSGIVKPKRNYRRKINVSSKGV